MSGIVHYHLINAIHDVANQRVILHFLDIERNIHSTFIQDSDHEQMSIEREGFHENEWMESENKR